MQANATELLVPFSYLRIIARELELQERDLPLLLRGTGLAVSTLLSGEETHVSSLQLMRALGNAQHLQGEPEIGLRLGRALQPSSHGPMGYLVLSSPDVITALESFADFLPVRLPFSSVSVTLEEEWLICSLSLKIQPDAPVLRVLQECFALMIQSVVESVLRADLKDARIALAHERPAYHALYAKYLHSPVRFSQPSCTFKIPAELARYSNAAGHYESYALARDLCYGLLEQMPAIDLSTNDRVRRHLLAAPAGTLTANDIARAMFVSKRTLQRRLVREGTSYREVTEKLNSEMALRHLGEKSLSIEAVAILLGYHDTSAFRKAFQRWYGKNPGEYRRTI